LLNPLAESADSYEQGDNRGRSRVADGRKKTYKQALLLFTANRDLPMRLIRRNSFARLTFSGRVLRGLFGVGVMLLACFGSMQQRTAPVEEQVEILEMRVEGEHSSLRLTIRPERAPAGRCGERVAASRNPAVRGWSQLTLHESQPGHRLSNGLRAPLIC
jgi:hypothetical protein